MNGKDGIGPGRLQGWFLGWMRGILLYLLHAIDISNYIPGPLVDEVLAMDYWCEIIEVDNVDEVPDEVSELEMEEQISPPYSRDNIDDSRIGVNVSGTEEKISPEYLI